MTISFIAVTDGYRADGYLIVQGQIFNARSGRKLADMPPGKHERGELPPGTYRLGEAMGLSAANQLTMTDGPGGVDNSRFRKFEIAPTASNRQRDPASGTWGVRDRRYPDRPRTHLRFHFDGDIRGSEGCIVYDDIKVQDALQAAHRAGDTTLEVIYLENDARARAKVREVAGREPPGP
jgi:hypothetical protein